MDASGASGSFFVSYRTKCVDKNPRKSHNTGLVGVSSSFEQLRGWTKRVDKKSANPCKIRLKRGLIFLEIMYYGGRLNGPSELPCLWQEMR